MLTSVPSGVTRADYGNSFWTTFERQVAGLISPSAQLLEISSDVRDKLSAGGFQSDDYYQVSLITMDTLRGAPVNPKSFAVDARKMHFEDVVMPNYEETFRVVMAEATKIDYRGLQVDNEKFRDIIAVFQQHSNVERTEYSTLPSP